MIYGSVCSGIEAATAAWHPLGWQPAFFSEIEPFPCAVLKHHYPHVPNHGDMTKFQEWPDADLDVLVGGTPCQSFSVAGLRKGLDDPRGNLMLTFGAIARRYRPEWLVWENVPGVLSSNGGRDFGAFLGMLGGLGYGFAYRVLDAQYFGLAQRRRRVFVVGCLGDWRRAAAVLFERHSLSGHPAPRREAGEGIAGRTACRAAVSSGQGWWDESDVGATLRAQDSVTKADTLTYAAPPVSLCLNAGGMGRQDAESETLIPTGGCFDAVPFDTTQITSAANYSSPKAGDPCHPLAAGAHAPAIAFGWQNSSSQGDSASEHVTLTLDKSKTPAVAFALRGRDGGATAELGDDLAFTLRASDGGGDKPHVLIGDDDARAYQTNSLSMLSALRRAAGKEAVAEWGSRILDSLQSPEVLRAWLHGASLRRAPCDLKSFVDDRPLPRAEGLPARAMQWVWENGPDGRSSQGRGLAKQLAHQLGKALPELPPAVAQEQAGMAVRRLTPKECERLMGFPDDFTAIPGRNKPASECPDGPRYKALGNSMAVSVMSWIGKRIAEVARIPKQEAAA